MGNFDEISRNLMPALFHNRTDMTGYDHLSMVFTIRLPTLVCGRCKAASGVSLN